MTAERCGKFYNKNVYIPALGCVKEIKLDHHMTFGYVIFNLCHKIQPNWWVSIVVPKFMLYFWNSEADFNHPLNIVKFLKHWFWMNWRQTITKPKKKNVCLFARVITIQPFGIIFQKCEKWLAWFSLFTLPQ